MEKLLSVINKKLDHRINFSNQEERELFYDMFGGENYVKENYDLAYQSLQKTELMHRNKSSAGSTDNAVAGAMLSKSMNSNNAMNSKNAASSSENIIYKLWIQHADTGVINQNIRQISYSLQINKNNQGAKPESGDFVPDSDGYFHNFSSNDFLSDCTFETPEDFVVIYGFITTYYANGSTENTLIKKTILGRTVHLKEFVFDGAKKWEYKTRTPALSTKDKPELTNNSMDKGMVLQLKNYLLPTASINYGRSPKDYNSNDCVLTYSDINKVGQDSITFKFPISGTLIFNNTYKPVGYSTGEMQTDRPVFNTSYSGPVMYKQNLNQKKCNEEIQKCFKISKDDPYKVDFCLSDDWNAVLNIQDLYGVGNVAQESRFTWGFAFTVTENNNFTHDIFINIGCCEKDPPSVEVLPTDKVGSVYSAKGDVIDLPVFHLYYGCFSKDTKIRMADGSEKLISLVQIGDIVMNDQGEKEVVQNVYTGKEDFLLRIETISGIQLDVTPDHPIMTERGMLRAGMISPVDSVIMADGKPEQIEYIYKVDYNDTVYNLDTGSASSLIANGIVSGNYLMQNQMKPEELKKNDYRLSEEEKQTIEQFKKMLSEALK